MKYLKKYNENLHPNLRIDHEDISDILLSSSLFDEFPELSFYIENTKYSYSLHRLNMDNQLSKKDCNNLAENSIMIELLDNNYEYNYQRPFLYYLETGAPSIWDIIKEINTMLTRFGLKIAYSDFGESDISYELIISDINYHLPINESSISALNYKYRKNDLIPDVEDILIGLKDNLITPKVFFQKQLSTDETIVLVVEMDSQWSKTINKQLINDTISHLIDFLKNENYELNYIYYEDKILDGHRIEILEKLPNEFTSLILKFEFTPAFIKYQK